MATNTVGETEIYFFMQHEEKPCFTTEFKMIIGRQLL